MADSGGSDALPASPEQPRAKNVIVRLCLVFVWITLAPVADAQQSGVTLAWDSSPSPNVVDYIIYQGVESGVYSRSFRSNGKTTTTMTGLNQGITYFWAVAAVDVFGRESDRSAELIYLNKAQGPDPTPNQAPFISLVSDQTTDLDSAHLTIPVSIYDPDTPLQLLALSANSSNPQLVPGANIIFDGSGSSRTVRIQAAPGQSGSAVIELMVHDGIAANAISFAFHVRPVTSSFPLTVVPHGLGRVHPNLHGLFLQAGAKYTLTAVPEPGYTFAGWTGDVPAASSSLAFVMRPNLVLEPVFLRDPFVSVGGTYSGMFQHEAFPTPGAGSLILTVTQRGGYSGKVAVEGKSYPLAGQLGFDRMATNQVKIPGGKSVTLEMGLLDDDSGQLVGRVIAHDWEAALEGYRNAAVASASTGSHTIVINSRTYGRTGPEGFGVGTVKISGNGGLTFLGTLGDGTKVSQKTGVSSKGEWALCVPLYGGQGFVSGWQVVKDGFSGSIRGTLQWSKPAGFPGKLYPAGFLTEAVLSASRYSPPGPGARVLDLTQTTLSFSGGDLPRPYFNSLLLDERNQVLNLSPNKLSLTISSSSGLFSGTVVDPYTGRSSRFSGAVLQDRGAGAGFLIGSERTSSLSLGY